MKQTDLLLRKTMTKKAFKEYQKKQRSVIGQMMNTGTISMQDGKDRIYARRNNKVDLRKIENY